MDLIFLLDSGVSGSTQPAAQGRPSAATTSIHIPVAGEATTHGGEAPRSGRAHDGAGSQPEARRPAVWSVLLYWYINTSQDGGRRGSDPTGRSRAESDRRGRRTFHRRGTGECGEKATLSSTSTVTKNTFDPGPVEKPPSPFLARGALPRTRAGAIGKARRFCLGPSSCLRLLAFRGVIGAVGLLFLLRCP